MRASRRRPAAGRSARRRARHRGRQLVLEDPGEIGHAQRAEDKDARPCARLAQLDTSSMSTPGHGARLFKPARDPHGPVPVCVGLDDSNDLRWRLLLTPPSD